MTNLGDDIDRLAPQKLLDVFSRGRAVRCIVLAAIIHVVVIGALSTTYIYYNWIDPEAGAALKEAERHEAGEQAAPGNPAAGPAASNAVVAAVKPKSAAPGAGGGDRQLVEQHGDSPVVREITDAATPDEIPKTPTPERLGISLEDTN